MQKMQDCPQEYYQNCRNALVKCHRCVAGLGNLKTKLQYLPIDIRLSHSYAPPKRQPLPKKDLAKSRQVKTALKREATGITQLARATLASGRLRHDGDAVHLDTLRVERKTRFKSRAVSVSSKELEKGKQQRINVFEIDLSLCRETYYVLTSETYTDLLAHVYSSRNSSSPQEEVPRVSHRGNDSTCQLYSDGLCWL